MKLVSADRTARLMRRLIHQDVEVFWAIALNDQKELLNAKCLAQGTVNCCHVHPRDIFRTAYAANATSIILVHNHCTYSPNPSAADISFTRRMTMIGEVLDIQIVDHIILSKTSFFSFVEHELTACLSGSTKFNSNESPRRQGEFTYRPKSRPVRTRWGMRRNPTTS